MDWFSSDWHYGHKNICYGVSEWPDKDSSCRKFDTIEEMNQVIINSINKYVKQDDTLYFLGDFSFGGVQNTWNCYKQLVCKNIIFITGNHDQHIIRNSKLPNCKRINSTQLIDGIPNEKEFFDEVYAESLFLATLPYHETFYDKTKFILCHYPLEEWNDRHHKTIHLHGHQHGRNRIIKNRIDVGIDNAFKIYGEYKPFSVNDIYENIQKQNKHV
jgi:calcineurin-like phosphoesterase family protein